MYNKRFTKKVARVRGIEDVVVVGAGYAGLAAARALARAGAGVRVLEARDRAGGRVHTVDHDGLRVDEGGMWIGPGQTRIAALAREYGATTYPSHARGEGLMVRDGRLQRFAGTLPPLQPHETAMVALAMSRIERLAASIDTDRPWIGERARRQDAQTLASALRTWIPLSRTRRFVSAAIGTVMAADPEELSLRSFLAYVRAGGGLESLMAIEGGAQQDLFADGADVVARGIAAELSGRLVFGAAVRSIGHDEGEVRIRCADSTVHRARIAVVALPPPLAGRITYDPPMPPDRDQLTQRMPMGSVFKAHAVYTEPFWRADGLSGEVIDVDDPVSATLDVGQPDGPGLVAVLVCGQAARDVAGRPGEERRRCVVDKLTRAFGKRAARPLAVHERCWAAEPFSLGGYGAVMPPGVLTAFGPALRQPVGRIHWAGTESATEWTGYIEGAVRSGERAAVETLSTLGRSPAVTG